MEGLLEELSMKSNIEPTQNIVRERLAVRFAVSA
jgi:hypothetical protein